MQKSGFQLTNEELRYLSDDDFLPMKRRLMDKLSEFLLGAGQELLSNPVLKSWCERQNAPLQSKVYKGENLKGLPYLVMDLPPIVAEREINLLRIVIWWGRYASVNLILSGTEWQKRKEMRGTDFLYNTTDVWDNDLDSESYTLLPSPDSKACRLALKLDLTELDKIPSEAMKLIDILH